jgi:metal-dependent amidase/aminoacylase/carboxypeptidase family protein
MGTIRTFTDSDSKLIYVRIKQIAKKTAGAAGATAEVILHFEESFSVTFNDEK